MPVPTSEKAFLTGLVKHILNEDQDPFTPLLDKYLLRRNDPKYADKRIKSVTLPMIPRDRTPGRLSPSSACGCERQAALKFLGVEGKVRTNPETEMVFEDGNWRHHKWDYIIQDMAAMFPNRIRVLAIEEPVRIDKILVAGHLDARVEIWWRDEWVEFVIDWKGANLWAYDYVFTRHTPKPEHVLQVACYCMAKNVRRGLLLYDSKNNNETAVYKIVMTKEKRQEVRSWCRRVIRQMDRKQLPPIHPDCHNGNFLYGKCPFAGMCFGKLDSHSLEKKVYRNFPGVEALWLDNLLKIEDDDG